MNRYNQFLNRLQNGWTPVPPLMDSDVDQVYYRCDTAPLGRPYAVFRLLDENEDSASYSHAKFIHIAGMVRHAAIELMKRTPPRDLRGRASDDWVDQYVAGHTPRNDASDAQTHTQFSYIPLPSVGHPNTDPAVRRVMIAAPVGDEVWLNHLANRLDGQILRPLPNTTLPPGTRLERISLNHRDGVRDLYTRESRTWASFTPVILPGHDDHKPAKTRKLIMKALAQSGIDQPCEFEWSTFSRFAKSYSARKYIRCDGVKDGKRWIGYIRPDHLLAQPAVHLTLRFGRREDPNNPDSRWIPSDHPIPGPITVGAGRHCGFGLFVAEDESK